MSLRPWYNKDANYQTNAKSFMDYLARTNHFLEVLIEDYENFQELVIEELEQIKFDSEEEVDDILVEWLEDGTLERIINDGVLGNKADKDDFSISPDSFEGNDKEKIEQAIQEAIQSRKSIRLGRQYDITGLGSISLDKAGSYRRVLRFIGEGTGIKKDDGGYIFTATNANTSDFYFTNVVFSSVEGSGTIVFDGNKLIRLVSSGCSYENIDSIAKTDHFFQSMRFIGDHVIGGKGSLFECVGAYDFHYNNNLVEWREHFFTQHLDMSLDHRRLRQVSFRDNVIEGITGHTFLLGEAESLVIDTNYFELNDGGYIEWRADTDYIAGVSIESNRGYDSVGLNRSFITLPKKVLSISLKNNEPRNMGLLDASLLEQGYVHSDNDGGVIVDPNNRVFRSGTRVSDILDDETLRVKSSSHGYYRRLTKHLNETLLPGETKTILAEFPMSIQLDDLISVQILEKDIQLLSVYRSHDDRRFVELRLKNMNDVSEYINSQMFITVLKSEYTTT